MGQCAQRRGNVAGESVMRQCQILKSLEVAQLHGERPGQPVAFQAELRQLVEVAQGRRKPAVQAGVRQHKGRDSNRIAAQLDTLPSGHGDRAAPIQVGGTRQRIPAVQEASAISKQSGIGTGDDRAHGRQVVIRDVPQGRRKGGRKGVVLQVGALGIGIRGLAAALRIHGGRHSVGGVGTVGATGGIRGSRQTWGHRACCGGFRGGGTSELIVHSAHAG